MIVIKTKMIIMIIVMILIMIIIIMIIIKKFSMPRVYSSQQKPHTPAAPHLPLPTTTARSPLGGSSHTARPLCLPSLVAWSPHELREVMGREE